ncbi:hypothetical protein EDB84DRAFT_808591 [Lactarius hengduanensis]|nr:hypothetical protein EDB84DRAFT_808591 [Lactarius hengduanensis]
MAATSPPPVFKLVTVQWQSQASIFPYISHGPKSPSPFSGTTRPMDSHLLPVIHSILTAWARPWAGHLRKLCRREHAGYVCFLFLQLGLRGISVLFASGDSGVGAGNSKDGSGNVRFTPPSSQPVCVALFLGLQAVHEPNYGSLIIRLCFRGPWVTTIGGTTSSNPEVAAAPRTTFCARTTRSRPCPPSSRTLATSIRAVQPFWPQNS